MDNTSTTLEGKEHTPDPLAVAALDWLRELIKAVSPAEFFIALMEAEAEMRSRGLPVPWKDPDDPKARQRLTERGEKHPRWKGGRRKAKGGYVLLTIGPDHPMASMAWTWSGHYSILEHRLVVAEAIGRPLRSEEVVHHRDHDRTNNELSNLLLLRNRAEHRQLHLLIEQGRTEEEALAVIGGEAEQTTNVA
jgi:HNH endonuclease